MNDEPPASRGPRWWPLLLLLALTAARLAQTWWLRDYERQFKYAATGRLLQVVLPVILIWFLCFSRLAWRTRLAGLGAAILLPVLVIGLFRIRGIDGDRLPVVEWRWAGDRHPVSAVVPGVPASGAPSPLSGAGGYPQFQGPNRDAILPAARLSTHWLVRGPERVWRQAVGEGWSGFAVAGGLGVSLEQAGEDEVVFALRLADGVRVWESKYPARYSDSSAGNGPRSTPTLAGERVYATGGTGVASCLELATGKVVWRVDMPGAFGARVPEWGYSASPLVQAGLVWLPLGAPGRSLVALDALTGALRFGGGDSAAAYASPVAATLGGREQILLLNATGLAGHDAADGRLLWEFGIPPAPRVAAPVVVGTNRVLVSVGYGRGAYLIRVAQGGPADWTAVKEWNSVRLKSKFANVIVRGETIYGLDDGVLVALELATGRLLWKERKYGHGQLVWAGDSLLVNAENGEVVLVNVRREGMEELGRIRGLAGKTWNPPALAGNLWLMRNDREAACYRLPDP